LVSFELDTLARAPARSQARAQLVSLPGRPEKGILEGLVDFVAAMAAEKGSLV